MSAGGLIRVDAKPQRLGADERDEIALPLPGRGFAQRDDQFIVGLGAGDLISELALAVEMGADATDIGKTIHPHPTLCESIGMAAEVFEGVCTDLPPMKRR